MAKTETKLTVEELAKALKAIAEPAEGKVYTAVGTADHFHAGKLDAAMKVYHAEGAGKLGAAKEYLSLRDTLKDVVKLNEHGLVGEPAAELSAEMKPQFDKLKQLESELGELAGKDAGKQINALSKDLGGMTGMLKSNGGLSLEGVGKTIKNNLTPGGGRSAVAFGRMGGTALCALGLADGVFRSKTNNGEDRSVITRVGEVALFAAGAAALLLLGKAHMGKAGAVVAHSH